MTAVGQVLFPRLGSLASVQQISSLGFSTRIGALLATVTSLVSAAITPIAIPALFGENFAGAIYPAIVLCFATSVYGWNYIVEEGLRGMGAPKAAMIAEAAGLTVTIIALILIVPHYGLVGAALSSLIGYVVTFSCILFVLRAKFGLGLTLLLIPSLDDVKRVKRILLRGHTNER